MDNIVNLNEFKQRKIFENMMSREEDMSLPQNFNKNEVLVEIEKRQQTLEPENTDYFRGIVDGLILAKDIIDKCITEPTPNNLSIA